MAPNAAAGSAVHARTARALVQGRAYDDQMNHYTKAVAWKCTAARTARALVQGRACDGERAQLVETGRILKPPSIEGCHTESGSGPHQS